MCPDVAITITEIAEEAAGAAKRRKKMGKVLMKGNEAIGEAAIRAGCLNYFAYPITPQSEVAEYLSKRLPEVGGVFLQGESEVAVSYMIFGAAGLRRAGVHHLLEPGHQPDERRHQLHRGRPVSGGVRQHHARRAGSGRHPARPRPTISRRPRAAGTGTTGCWSWPRPASRRRWK